MRILLDTNVILDVAMRRVGLVEGSARALERCEHESHEMYVSWHTLSTLFYILQKDRGAADAVGQELGPLIGRPKYTLAA